MMNSKGRNRVKNIVKSFCSKGRYKKSPFQRLLDAMVKFVQSQPFINDIANDKNDVLFVLFNSYFS